MQTFCYSARKDGAENILLHCGTITAENMEDAFSRLLKQYPVKVKASGRLVQTDKHGHEFSIRILRPLDSTPEGKAALSAYHKERELRAREAEEKENALRDALESKIDAAGGLEAFLSSQP